MTDANCNFIKSNIHKRYNQTENPILRVCSFSLPLSQRSHHPSTLIRSITSHLIFKDNNNPFAQARCVMKNITRSRLLNLFIN